MAATRSAGWAIKIYCSTNIVAHQRTWYVVHRTISICAACERDDEELRLPHWYRNGTYNVELVLLMRPATSVADIIIIIGH
jgi:hypothetical protein